METDERWVDIPEETRRYVNAHILRSPSDDHQWTDEDIAQIRTWLIDRFNQIAENMRPIFESIRRAFTSMAECFQRMMGLSRTVVAYAKRSDWHAMIGEARRSHDDTYADAIAEGLRAHRSRAKFVRLELTERTGVIEWIAKDAKARSFFVASIG